MSKKASKKKDKVAEEVESPDLELEKVCSVCLCAQLFVITLLQKNNKKKGKEHSKAQVDSPVEQEQPQKVCKSDANLRESC